MRKFCFALLLFICFNSTGQTTINSATFGMMEARHLGPGTMSGRITAIEGVNEDGKTLYVGTAGGGIWKSTNAGASFKPIFDKYCQSLGSIAIDQKNPKTVYAGTGESNMRNSVSIGNGLYKTTDGGDNWIKIGLDSTEHIARIAIDPKNSNTIYVAAPGPLWSDSKHRGLYKSIDAGKTWEKILFINDKAGCAEVALDPGNPEVVYASTWEFRRLPYMFSSGGAGSGMYKSVDGGKTWKELTNGLPGKPFGRIAFTLAPSAPSNLVAIVESSETGLYISADGGESWKKQSAILNVVARPFYFSTIVIDPKDEKRVYRPAYTFSFSVDGGYSFAEAGSDGVAVHADHHALWINPNNTNQLYLGTDGGIYYSLDKGGTWFFAQNLPVGQFYHVAVDNKTPYNIMGGLQDNGSWIAPSAAPGGVNNAHWLTINGGDGFWVQPDRNDPDIVYAESQGGNINRINIKTTKAVGIKPQQVAGEEKLRWNWNTPIVTGVAGKKNLYIGAQHLYKSTDQGRNWKRISPDLTTNDKKKQEQENSGGLSADNTSAENHCTIFTIAESPLDENMIWVGTDDGNLQFTEDGGKTWTNTAKNYTAAGIPAQTWVSSIEPSLFDKNVVFASFDNHMYGDHNTYVAKSTDKGKTWTMFNSSEFTGFAHKVKQDLVNKDLLFIGTEMGLFASVDAGASWFRMKNKVPDYSLVRDIQIHPTTHDLILATHGRGIIVVDDISPMRKLDLAIANKEVHLFANDPIKLTTGTFGGGALGADGGWRGGNPPSVPPIQYYLKDRVASGKVVVEVYDANGKLVQSIPASNRRGINKVYWNLRSKPPKTASGGSKMDYGGFIAPMVLPGEYSIKLKIGDKEYPSNITLVHNDANKDFTMEDRVQQHKVATDIYNMHEQLAKTVDDINARQKMLKENITRVKSKKVKTLLEEYHTQLETLRAECLATKQKSLFADEVRLRERITDVYMAVSMEESVPGNLQLERVQSLKQELTKVEQTNAALTTKYYNKVKDALVKEGVIKDEKPGLEVRKGN
ncbi:MAG: glycosyl hydrolase [Chitinophagaceae bacterium]|nr:glycosyl hydrolase [Chitinophagaceae bacterium]